MYAINHAATALLLNLASAIVIGCRSKSTGSRTENQFTGGDSANARLATDSINKSAVRYLNGYENRMLFHGQKGNIRKV
jgi:hypothetical protein